MSFSVVEPEQLKNNELVFGFREKKRFHENQMGRTGEEIKKYRIDNFEIMAKQNKNLIECCVGAADGIETDWFQF